MFVLRIFLYKPIHFAFFVVYWIQTAGKENRR